MMLNSKLSKSILFVFLGLSLACSSSESQNSSNNNQSQGRTITLESELSFINADGSLNSTLKIAIADEPSERQQGLMDVRNMAQDEGMLFIFEENRPQAFWMANTPLSLDIMYVNIDSVIVRIYPDTIPFSETTLPSGEPTKYVVETNAGYALANGITEGMKVRF